MSQECKIKTRLRNLQLIKRAVADIGWTFHDTGVVRTYWGTSETCAHTIEMIGDRVNPKYNLGLQQEPDGSWGIVCDNSMLGPEIKAEGVYGGETPRIVATLKAAYAKQGVNAAARLKHGKVRDHGVITQDGRRKRLLSVEI